MREVNFVPGQYYHIFNRAIDEKEIFSADSDFMRALVSLVVFNNVKDSPQKLSRFVREPLKLVDEYTPDSRDRLVDIIAFTILPTHIHLFVRELVKNGISRFAHRLFKGYSRYFNLKNDRSGSLWQGAFKAKHVDNESYFVHIISYIHLNILDLYQPEWREGEIDNWSELSPKLVNYPWSSYTFYRTGASKIPLIRLILAQPEWLSEYYPNPESFEESLRSWSGRSNIYTVTE